MVELGVDFNLECAHMNTQGVLHGHSYVVTVWFEPLGRSMDIDVAARKIREAGSMIDHTVLEESVGGGWMEHIALWLFDTLDKHANIAATRINIHRPTLGLSCEFRA